MKPANDKFPVKRLPDGRAMVNLGSSARSAPDWNNIDSSWLVRLGKHRLLCSILFRLGLLSIERYRRITSMDKKTILWDLSKGIPFADQTFDVVYHCHVLEHIDRENALSFVKECNRVLKTGGIIRIVVPDFEIAAKEYVDIVNRLPHDATMVEHTNAMESMIDQMVVRTPRYRRQHNWIVRFFENLLIGNTASAGVLHRWMYDRFSVEQLLKDAGFSSVKLCDENTSAIKDWNNWNLDVELDGTPYKPGSIYVEAKKV